MTAELGWDDKIRRIHYTRERDSFEVYTMNWYRKERFVALVEDIEGEENKADFQEFVIDNIEDFDDGAFEMLFKIMKFTPEEMTDNFDFYDKIYSKLEEVDPNRLGFTTTMRLAWLKNICEKE